MPLGGVDWGFLSRRRVAVQWVRAIRQFPRMHYDEMKLVWSPRPPAPATTLPRVPGYMYSCCYGGGVHVFFFVFFAEKWSGQSRTSRTVIYAYDCRSSQSEYLLPTTAYALKKLFSHTPSPLGAARKRRPLRNRQIICIMKCMTAGDSHRVLGMLLKK